MIDNLPIRLLLFGRPRVECDLLTVDHFPTRRSAYILARLAIAHQRRMSRIQLADVLWPDDAYEISRQRMRKELSRLALALGDLARIVTVSGEFVSLNGENLIVDIDEFERFRALALAAEEEDRKIDLLQHALQVADAPFFADSNEDWIQIERMRLNVMRCNAMVDLGNLLLPADRAAEALDLSQAAIAMAPEREDAHLVAIQALRKLGHHGDAANRMEVLRRMVATIPGGRLSEGADKLAADLARIHAAPPSQSQPYLAPAPLEPLFGRGEQLELLTSRLDPVNSEVRLVTVLGMGGIGKSHLLRHACRHLANAYGGRVRLIDLSDLTDARLVPTTILQALGLGYSPTDDPMLRLVRVLANAPTLLVLDNLEQFESEVAPIVRRLLDEAPKVRVLAGSRTPLQLSGELKMQLGPLVIPGESARREEAESSAAVELFLNCVEANEMGSRIQAQDWPAISNIVRRLDGVPLGLQLAASRLRTLGPDGLLQELDAGLDRLVNWRTDAPARHHSIRNAVAGSFDDLEPALRHALASLAIFRGGWPLEAARQVCGIERPEETMQRLMDASLVQGGRSRFWMLETIREYALELLDESEARRLRHSLLDWLLKRSETVAFEMVTREVLNEIDRLEPELDNIREAIAFAREEAPESALDLAANCLSLWLYRTNGFEAAQCYADLFQRHANLPPSPVTLRASYAHSVVLHCLGAKGRKEAYARTAEIGREIGDLTYAIRGLVHQAYYCQNEVDYTGCQRRLAEIEAFRLEHGEMDSWGFVHRMRGTYLHYQRDLEPAIRELRAAVAWFEEKKDLFNTARARHNLASAALDAHDTELARIALAGSLDDVNNLRFTSHTPRILGALGRLAFEEGRLYDAIPHMEASIEGWREIGDLFFDANQQTNLARVYGALGQHAEARRLYCNAATMFVEAGYPMGVCLALFGISDLLLHKGEAMRAARIYVACRQESIAANAKFLMFSEEFCIDLEQRLRSELGNRWPDSNLLTLEEAMRLGLAD